MTSVKKISSTRYGNLYKLPSLLNQSPRPDGFQHQKIVSLTILGGQESKIKMSVDFWGSEGPSCFSSLMRTVSPWGSLLAASPLQSLPLLARGLLPVGLSVTKSPSLNNEATSHILWRTQPIPLWPHLY